MIIKKITIKNFKSFGNNEQIIELNPKYGELILLSGRNGAGKSSIPEAIDYCLFNKVKGKKKKHIVLSALPMRNSRKSRLVTGSSSLASIWVISASSRLLGI
jgi:DNA repair exonuclease SbcCD ATPase subunit